MRYGAIPIARNTGSLADTIQHGNTGYLFNKMHANDFIQTLDQAQTDFNSSQKEIIINNLFRDTHSWQQTAKEYIKLYMSLLS